MSEEIPATAVVFHGEAAPKVPKATPLDWLKYYVYNLARKPLVWKKQKRLLAISEEIQTALHSELFPHLLKRKPDLCRECLDASMALKPQIFVSQIEFGLKHLRCDNHPEPFVNFTNAHGHLFRESEELARWINGFAK